MSDRRPDAPRSEPEPVEATEVERRGLCSSLRTCLVWVKVVIVVVLVVLFVIALLQNIEQRAKIMVILERWSPDNVPVALIIGVSFAGGVVITLLLMLLRHGSHKHE